MGKVKYLTFLFLFLANFVAGQELKFGLLAGLTGSQITGDGFGGYSKLGLDGGIFVRQNLDENWKLQAELKFIAKGDANYFTTQGAQDIFRTNLQYFEVPVLAVRTIAKNVEAELGLAAAYLTDATVTTTSTGSQALSTSKYDFSAVAGVYYIYSDNLSINLKLSYSVIPIDYLGTYITWQGNLGRYNNVLELAVYYTLSSSRREKE